MVAIAQLGSIALDCADHAELAAFWAALLDGEIVYRAVDFSVVRTERGILTTSRVPGYRPPDWPDGPQPKHIHLDLVVTDLDASETAAVALGARRAESQPGPDRWRVLFDPAGHPFCLTTLLPLLPLGSAQQTEPAQ